jgi:hypothetical protein
MVRLLSNTLPVALCCLLVGSGCQGSTKKPVPTDGPSRRYDMEHGLVEYALDGMETGTEVVRFRDFGLREVKQRQSELNLGADVRLPTAQTGSKRVITVLEGATIVSYDPDTRSGTRTLHTLERLGSSEAFRGKSMVEMSKQMYTKMGGKIIGTKTIAGETCDIWKIDKLSTETCVYKGIALEVSTELAGLKQHAVATRIDWKETLSDAAMVVPEDVLEETDLAKQVQPQGPTTPTPTGNVMSPEDALRLLRESAPK